MKMMFHTMLDCTPSLISTIKINSNFGKPVNVKDVTDRFIINLIGSCAFGIDCNALNQPDCEFQKFGQQLANASWRNKVTLLTPKVILDLVGFRTIARDTENFFMGVVKDIVDYREKNNVYRQDFMHMMLQMRNRGTYFTYL